MNSSRLLEIVHRHKIRLVAITIGYRKCLLELDLPIMRIVNGIGPVNGDYTNSPSLAALSGILGPDVAPILLVILTSLATKCRAGHGREDLDQDHADGRQARTHDAYADLNRAPHANVDKVHGSVGSLCKVDQGLQSDDAHDGDTDATLVFVFFCTEETSQDPVTPGLGSVRESRNLQCAHDEHQCDSDLLLPVQPQSS